MEVLPRSGVSPGSAQTSADEMEDHKSAVVSRGWADHQNDADEQHSKQHRPDEDVSMDDESSISDMDELLPTKRAYRHFLCTVRHKTDKDFDAERLYDKIKSDIGSYNLAEDNLATYYSAMKRQLRSMLSGKEDDEKRACVILYFLLLTPMDRHLDVVLKDSHFESVGEVLRMIDCEVKKVKPVLTTYDEVAKILSFTPKSQKSMDHYLYLDKELRKLSMNLERLKPSGEEMLNALLKFQFMKLFAEDHIRKDLELWLLEHGHPKALVSYSFSQLMDAVLEYQRYRVQFPYYVCAPRVHEKSRKPKASGSQMEKPAQPKPQFTAPSASKPKASVRRTVSDPHGDSPIAGS